MTHKILTFFEFAGSLRLRRTIQQAVIRVTSRLGEVVDNKYGESARRQAWAEMKRTRFASWFRRLVRFADCTCMPHGAGGNRRIEYGEPAFDHQAQLQFSFAP